MVNREVLVALVEAADTVFADAITDTVASDFTRYRSNSATDGVDRSVVIEESMDQVAASEIDGGTYMAKGNFDGAFRIDPTSLKLIQGIMGVPVSGTPAKTYYLEQVPQEMQLFYIDEQANANAGTGTYYQGVGINSLELSLDVKGYCMAKWGWLGQRGVTTDTPVNDAAPPTYSNYPMLIFYNATITFATSPIKLKGFTLTCERKYDTDYFYIGSQFLQGLYFNGMTTLGGTMKLGAGEWDLLERTINGTTSPGGLDGAHTQFTGINVNAIASGALAIVLRKPNVATTAVVTINVASCKITKMDRSVKGRNMWEKSVEWQAQLSSHTDFSIVTA